MNLVHNEHTKKHNLKIAPKHREGLLMFRNNRTLSARNSNPKIIQQRRVDGIYTMMYQPRYSNKLILVFTPEDQEILGQIKRD